MTDRLQARELARARVAGLRARVSLLRRRALAFTAGTFALLWGLIFVRMATGHDPVLGSRTAATASAATTSQPLPATSGDDDPFESPALAVTPAPAPVAPPVVTSSS